MPGTRLIILAKAPVPGHVKTRLIPVLGAADAARLARHMLEWILRESLHCGADEVELCGAPAADDPVWNTVLLPEGIVRTTQCEGDVGERMLHVLTQALASSNRVVLAGADCPGMDRDALRRSIDALNDHDATLIPAHDGGYVLIGLKRIHPAIMRDIPWSTPGVLTRTLEHFAELDFSVSVQPPMRDIDGADDLKFLPDRPPFTQFFNASITKQGPPAVE